MSYNALKIGFSKEHINIVEMDLDACSLTFGTGDCAAVGSGDAKCFNTFGSCHYTRGLVPADPESEYLKETKVYRFCEDRSPHPIGLDAIPSLRSVNTSPSKIDLSGGLGVRSSVSLSFTDHPSSDIGIDNYVDGRTYIASERGSYWTKLRARNPNYENRPLRVLSGYLVDGKFDPLNFTTRYYIIDKMNVTNGMATITAKDPLKLAGSKKAQAPIVTTGQLSADLIFNVLTATLIPVGIGELEYPVSGKVLINSEVIAFTRVLDVLTLTRAQNNTVAVGHSEDDTVQLCLEYAGKQVDFIVKDLLTNYANIDASFIDDAAWTSEIDVFLSGGLSGVIVKPFDVFKLLKELAESMPHYLWWDERNQTIQLTALKAPPENANVINMDGNIIDDSFKTTDKPELRKSTIFVNFGQFDPTKKLDEPSNYQQTYARIDTASIAKYGSNEIQTINSRWISSTNKAAALTLGALIGRRFSDIPREASFSLEAKDSSIWIGQSIALNHRDITDFSGSPIDTVFQLLSSKESKNFDYTGLEFTYGDKLPNDPDPEFDTIILGSDLRNINLRTEYDLLFPTPDGTTQAIIIIDEGVKIGSASTATYSIDTGSWPAGAEVTLQIKPTAFAVGKGGGGGNSFAGDDGGHAIILNHDLILANNGVIGGGGGGGGGFEDAGGISGGGGGAGFDVGLGGIGTGEEGGSGSDGTLETGGNGGSSNSGDGGDLGQDGEAGQITLGGIAGDAINKNGFTLTGALNDTRGAVIV